VSCGCQYAGTADIYSGVIPLKCCSSLISRRARLARIFLLKTLVTFLMATPSPVWLLVAALCRKVSSCLRVAVVEAYQTMP
jgi:hypothetical protein